MVKGMYRSRLRDLEGFLNFSMSLVFTYLCVSSQTKTLTLKETLDFHINLVVQKGIVFVGLDKANKKNLHRK